MTKLFDIYFETIRQHFVDTVGEKQSGIYDVIVSYLGRPKTKGEISSFRSEMIQNIIKDMSQVQRHEWDGERLDDKKIFYYDYLCLPGQQKSLQSNGDIEYPFRVLNTRDSQ